MEESIVITLPDSIGYALLVLLMAILVDAILGMLISIKDKTFEWSTLAKFVISGVVTYVGGILVLALAAQLAGLYFRELFYIIGGIIAIKYSAEIFLKAKQLFTFVSMVVARRKIAKAARKTTKAQRIALQNINRDKE